MSGTVMAKRCSSCKSVKKDEDFYHRSDKPHLLQSYCIDCIKQKRKKYREENIEKFKRKDRFYHERNRAKRLKYLKDWQFKNKHKRYAKEKKRAMVDIHFAIKRRLHNRIKKAIKNNSKHTTTVKYLGCSIEFFKKYFTSLFVDSMTWDDFLCGKIHIDHIIPCSKFDLSQEQDQLICFHYTNLQPLWAKDNIKKRNR